MKNVLIVSYYFPPAGMGGIQRAAKFVKYLPSFGWNPLVLTVKDIAYYAKDETFLEDVKEAETYRTHSLDPLRISYSLNLKKSFKEVESGGKESFFRSLSTWLFVPDNKILWLPFAVRQAVKLCKKKKIDLVFTTAPPFSAHLIGSYLKKRLKIPWVADFRDGWTHGEQYRTATTLHDVVNRRLEKSVIVHADAVTGVAEDIIDKLRHDTGKKYYVITNGFDTEDFPGSVKVDNTKFIMTFGGTAVEMVNPNTFAPVIKNAVQKNREFERDYEVHFAGLMNKNRVKKIFAEYGIPEKKMVFFDYLNHKNYIDHLVKSHLLLFTISEKSSRGLITGRIFELLATQVPILAVVPDSEAREIINMSGNETFCHGEKEKASEKLLAVYKQWRLFKSKTVEKKIEFSPLLLSMSRKKLTEIVSLIFNEVSEVKKKD